MSGKQKLSKNQKRRQKKKDQREDGAEASAGDAGAAPRAPAQGSQPTHSDIARRIADQAVPAPAPAAEVRALASRGRPASRC